MYKNGEEDPLDSSDIIKSSHDSFAQFAASGDFMFDTAKNDFVELSNQLDKATNASLEE